MTTYDDYDLFAGPGGWDTGIAPLGIVPVGFEWDGDAILTARAAGHIRAYAYTDERGMFRGPDIASLDPLDCFTPGQVRGGISSPPCQGFSKAGKGKGRDDAATLLEGINSLAHRFVTGAQVDEVIAALRERMTDTRSILVLEPLRWALHLRPQWVAWEQVPGVLPIWQACAEVLRAAGYSVDVGGISAEQFGVPQTRKRAILVARSAAFTAEHGPASLPTPTHSRYHSRNPSKLDPGVEKWVSMGDALTWASTDLVGFPRLSDGRGEDVVLDGVAYRARDLRPAALPAQSVTEKARSWQRWTPEFNDQSGTPYDPEWPFKRPATVVAGRGLVQNPGATANRTNGSTKSRNDGVKVEVWEAGVLQSFPADYPFHGSKTAQYRQAGDAVPPLMAQAIVAEVSAAKALGMTKAA